MKFKTYQSNGLQFKFPDFCHIAEDAFTPQGGDIELRSRLSTQSIGLLFVSLRCGDKAQSLAVLADHHRKRLLAQGIQVADGYLIPAPAPDRFDEAALFWPKASKDGIAIETPVTIYRKANTFLSIALIGPLKQDQPQAWEANQAAFEAIRDTLELA